MSELLDKITKVQARTGCTVLEGKRFLELADGDIDLAVMIAKEEMAKGRPSSSYSQPSSQYPQNQQYGQPQRQRPSFDQRPSYQDPQRPQYGQQPQYGQPQPQPQPQQHQYYEDQNNYMPEYGQPAPGKAMDANKKMKITRMVLYGMTAVFALGALLMFFGQFLVFNLFAGYGGNVSGFDLLGDSNATKESPSIFALIVPIIFDIAMLGASPFFMWKFSEKRTPIVFGFAGASFIAAILVFCTVSLSGSYGQGCELGGGAIGSGLFSILAAATIVAAGFLPNVFAREQRPMY